MIIIRRLASISCVILVLVMACDLPMDLADTFDNPSELLGTYQGTGDLRAGNQLLSNRTAFLAVMPEHTGDFVAICHVSETNSNRVTHVFADRPGTAVSGSSRHVRSGVTLQSTVDVRKSGGVVTGSCRMEQLMNDGTWSLLYEIMNISVAPR